MDQRKKINDLLNKLLAQNEEYLSDKSFLYKIEKDIFLAQVRELYEILAQIPVHHQLEVGNEQELFTISHAESLFDAKPESEERIVIEDKESTEVLIPIEENENEKGISNDFSKEEPPKTENPVSKLEKLLAELRGWGQSPEAAVSPLPDAGEPVIPAMVEVASAEKVEEFDHQLPSEAQEEASQEVAFDLGLTSPSAEERPSYFTLERKVQEDEWGTEESETSKPRVAIMNPFVGGRSEPELIETASPIPSSTSTEAAADDEPQTPLKAENTANTPPPKEVETESHSGFSIMDTLQLASNTALKNQLHLKPMDSLKTGIGLNEKFLYIRELFGNDHINFANTIAQLNDFTQMQQAENLLYQQFIKTGKWETQNPHVQTFLQLIYRRFS